MPVEQMLPNNLFILPVVGNPVFPGLFTPLMLSDAQDIDIINQATKHGGFLGLLLTRSDQEKEGQPTPADMYEMGTVAKIVKRIKLPEGGESVFISTLKRFKVNEYYRPAPILWPVWRISKTLRMNPMNSGRGRACWSAR